MVRLVLSTGTSANRLDGVPPRLRLGLNEGEKTQVFCGGGARKEQPALCGLAIDVLPDHPAQAAKEKKRQGAPRRKGTEGRIAEIADFGGGGWDQSRGCEDQEYDHAGEKYRGEGLAGHRA